MLSFTKTGHSLCQLSSLLWACFRLGRFHTVMGYAIFPCPAILTVIIFHGAYPHPESLERVWSLSWRLFLCILSYRGAGLAWDDIIDRKIDSQVTRTKARPLPSGDISVVGAVIFCIFQSAMTVALFHAILPNTVGYVNILGSAIFVVYPFLKFYTYWAQLGGAILMACVVPTAWAACMTVSGDSTTFDLDFLATLLATNGPLLAACFMIEVLFSFVHETVYGCQDTPEDMKLGVYSTSILLGYSGSKRVVLWLTPLYIGTLACTLNAANLHGYVLSVVPGYVLVRDACKIKMDDPISCSMYARRGIYVKVGICIGAALDLAFINAKRSIPSI